jgi:hypothetical protein
MQVEHGVEQRAVQVEQNSFDGNYELHSNRLSAGPPQGKAARGASRNPRRGP